VLATEDAIEQMLKALDETGQRERTILLYLGDNGYAWGEHGYRGKNCAYEVCSRVPFLYLDPRRRSPAGLTIDALVADIDVAPTIAGLAGVTVPAADKMDGSPLEGLLGPTPPPWRDHLLTECWGRNREAHPDTHASVRNKKWKYVEHFEDDARTKRARSGGRDELELYDLEKDPDELDNLLALGDAELAKKGHGRAALDKVVADLAPRLAKLMAEK
jgi:N-acetylglucosamine-6-sulfatase